MTGSDGYSKDKNSVFFLGKKIIGADARRFVLVPPYGKDAQHVYYGGAPIALADAPSFQMLGPGYYRDKHAFYFDGNRIASDDTAHASTDHEFLINASQVYRANQKLPYDGRTFSVLAAVSGGNTCNPTTISVLTRDKNGTYYRDEKLPYSLSPTPAPALFADRDYKQLYTVTRDGGFQKAPLSATNTHIYRVTGTTLLLDRKDHAAYLVDEYDIKKLDASELGLDIDTLQPYMQFRDETLWFKDQHQFYRLEYGLTPESSLDPQSSLIFFYRDGLVLRQPDGKDINVTANSVEQADSDMPSRYRLEKMQFIAGNSVLKKKGIDTGAFLVPDALVRSDGSLLAWITPNEYRNLQHDAVPSAKFERLRQDYMQQWERKHAWAWPQAKQ